MCSGEEGCWGEGGVRDFYEGGGEMILLNKHVTWLQS